MTTIETERPQAVYALGHTAEEYERLRMQARMWEAATGRLLDEVGIGAGASCLDAGCGPGETMRLMAERVGPAGRVLGIDADASLGAQALAMLHGAGHGQCAFHAQDLTASEPVPGGPFDLVYARLLLFHLPRRIEVLAWRGCGTRSPQAGICSCRTTNCAASVPCPSWTASASCCGY
jgi:ubiquinone/menaquinone biosynthesis C-methylase UbiE